MMSRLPPTFQRPSGRMKSAGNFMIVATARPGGDLARIEKAIDEELARFLANGPTTEEMQRVRQGRSRALCEALSASAGFGGKSDVLAMNETFRGDPGFYQTPLKYTREATAQDLAARRQAMVDR